jgi:hypothetical protein
MIFDDWRWFIGELKIQLTFQLDWNLSANKKDSGQARTTKHETLF